MCSVFQRMYIFRLANFSSNCKTVLRCEVVEVCEVCANQPVRCDVTVRKTATTWKCGHVLVALIMSRLPLTYVIRDDRVIVFD